MANVEYLEGKELQELRTIAEDLGIEFPKNIGKVKLIDKIVEAESQEDVTPVQIEGVRVKKKTPAEIKKEMNILKRVRVSPNDPQHKGRNGVTRKIGNKYGVVGKFIPFDTVWHCPEPVYNDLKEAKYRVTKFKTDSVTGMKVAVTKWYPAFVIEDLPQLTAKELKKLAAEQASRGSIPSEEN